MKKTILAVALASCAFANAQYFEDFETGVPGTMVQTYVRGTTTFIDFGLSALNVPKALSESNSAVFFNAMETQEITTSLETPVLDLTTPDMSLEFKYYQKQKTEGYANVLYVELSNDEGVTWQKITSCESTGDDIQAIHVGLAPYNPTSRSIVKFNCKQLNYYMGYPIAIDDISIDVHPKPINASRKKASSGVALFPNPSNGIFNLTTNQTVSVTITDSNGRTVYSQNDLSADTTINLSNSASGVYYAKISSLNNQEIKKLIIK